MTIFQLIDTLQKIAKCQPNVRSTSEGDIYRTLNNNPQTEYDVVHIMQNTHQHLEYFDRYNLTIFFVSRLVDDLESNRLQCQSVGKEVLNNIIRDFCDMYDLDFPSYTVQCFTEKFIDLCAGCYVTLTFEIATDACADDFSEVISIYQTKTIDIDENGEYVVIPDSGYSALDKVIINVDVPQSGGSGDYDEGFADGYDSGYTDGYQDGLEDCGKDYEEGFEDGYESGVTDQKNKLISIYIDSNGQYNRTDGYNSITVNVPQSGHTDEELEEAYQSGITYQKSLLSTTALTTNGLYETENGWDKVLVNVPQTGYTQEDLDNAYNEGYNDGLEDCSKTYLAVSENNIELTYSAQTKIIDILSNTDWMVVNYPQWCTVSPSSGTNDGSLTITVSENTGTERLGTITLSTKDLTKTVQISLKQKEDYTPSDYTLEPLTFEIVSGGYYSIKAIDSDDFIQYSKNKGQWITIDYNTIIPVSEGDIVQIRGNNLTNNRQSNHLNFDFIGGNCTYNVYGNIMSLVHPTDFSGLTTLNGSFECLFLNNDKVLSAENLILPATTLSTLCYWGMFQDCSNLTIAPALPATVLTYKCYEQMFQNCTSLEMAPELLAPTLADSCYHYMFDGCTNLNYIKCLATDISASACTNNWVNGVSSTGTFVKAAGMNDWQIGGTGYNGIPSGWTIIDATE